MRRLIQPQTRPELRLKREVRGAARRRRRPHTTVMALLVCVLATSGLALTSPTVEASTHRPVSRSLDPRPAPLPLRDSVLARAGLSGRRIPAHPRQTTRLVTPAAQGRGGVERGPLRLAAAAAGATFSVRVILAAKGPKPHLDPKLAQMKREFRPFQGQYNQFTLVRAQTLRLALNQSGAVALPKGQRFGLKMLGFSAGKVRRIRYEVQLPRSRMKRSVAPGARTLDVIQGGGKLTIISTTVR